MTEARTVDEAYSSAGNTSDLTVKAERRSDADVLIACGMTPGKRWCMYEGERYPMSKPVFARMVARVAKDGLCVRKAKLRMSETVRMWLPAPPPDDVEFGAWARDAIDAFEARLKEYQGDV